MTPLAQSTVLLPHSHSSRRFGDGIPPPLQQQQQQELRPLPQQAILRVI
jgi:hypothetical protein